MSLVWIVVASLAGLVLLLVAVNELVGRPIMFLRWSGLRMLFGMKRLMKEWQVGDGREEECARFVEANAPKGDLDAAIAAIDRFAYRKKFLINVGDEKGGILDEALARAKPMRALELGAYVGYSALRTVRRLPPGGRLYSIEFNPANAAIARRVAAHAGVADRVTFVDGAIGDGGATVKALAEQHGFRPGSLDFVFIDHAKEHYLGDLQTILGAGWLHAGSVVVADNVGFPGAPDYRAYMDGEQGKRWRTTTHRTHVEYQKVLNDLVLESVFLG